MCRGVHASSRFTWTCCATSRSSCRRERRRTTSTGCCSSTEPGSSASSQSRRRCFTSACSATTSCGSAASRFPRRRFPSLEQWYREQARVELARVVAREAQRLDVTYTRVTVRDQSTRWGSCSKAGALSFNWRLVVAPSAILTYVVVHELCHRIRHDHSTEFWAAVAARAPDVQGRARLARGARPRAARVPRSETARSVSGPLGDVRLLRHAGRLERRHPRRARAASSATSAPTSCSPLPRARAELEARRRRCSYREVMTEAMRRLGARLARSGRARPRRCPTGAVPGGAGRPRGGARARLEARDPLEHRPRLHRGVEGARSASRSTRRSSPARSARTSRRPATGRSSRSAPGRPAEHVHVGAQPLPRRRPGDTSSGSRRSGSTGSARPPSRLRRWSWTTRGLADALDGSSGRAVLDSAL